MCTLWILSASVVNVFSDNFTTETQSSTETLRETRTVPKFLNVTGTFSVVVPN